MRKEAQEYVEPTAPTKSAINTKIIFLIPFLIFVNRRANKAAITRKIPATMG